MDIVCIKVIFVGQLCSIQLADREIFKVSEITFTLYLYRISGNQNGDARGYCFRTLKIIFVVISPFFIQTKFDNKHGLIE